MNEELINKFGFSEMYEWAVIPDAAGKHGKFVQFDPHEPDKICLCKDPKKAIGVTTVNTAATSDDPDTWPQKNMMNEYGDIYLQKEKLAVGQKVYDQLNEMAYIRTSPWEHLIPIENKLYNPERQYVKRSNRAEWIHVHLMGKVIVEDDGKCEPGKQCKIYVGKIANKLGTVVPATEKDKNTYYVIKRISEKTIMILYK